MGEKKNISFEQLNKGGLKNFSIFEPRLGQFVELLERAAAELKEHTHAAQANPDSIAWWDNLIEQWITAKDLPLYIRKTNSTFPRGSVHEHKKTGRILIPCDNGPAHWTFSMCANNNLLTLNEIREFIEEDRVPIAMIIKGNEKFSKYRQTKHEIDQPNEKGWKIAHRKSIGLKTSEPINQIDITLLEEHFRQFLRPANMFLIPKKYSGFAEIEEVIKIFSTHPKVMSKDE